MTVSLLTIGKNGVRKEIPLQTDAIVIGRKAEADLRIPRPEVSRAHCEILINGKKISLRDLGSSNGTFVNARKVKEAVLKAGDQVKIGPVVFVVQVDGVPATIAPPAASKPKPGPAAPAAPREKQAQVAGKAAGDTDEFDIDELGELDVDDLSDLDLDGVGEGSSDDSGEGSGDDAEVIEDIEEIDESDLVPDDDEPKGGKK